MYYKSDARHILPNFHSPKAHMVLVQVCHYLGGKRMQLYITISCAHLSIMMGLLRIKVMIKMINDNK